MSAHYTYMLAVRAAGRAIGAALVPLGLAIAWTGHYSKDIGDATTGLVHRIHTSMQPPPAYPTSAEFNDRPTPDQQRERLIASQRVIVDV